MDSLEVMRIFAAVAEHGSFSEASRRLRLSPSVATRSIAQLEAKLGLTLITRSTRSIKLTEKGSVYLESCVRILAEVDDAERRVRGENAEPRGELKVSAPIVFGRLHVLPVVETLLSMYPQLSVRLILSDRNMRLVDGGIDVAVRIGDLPDSGLIAVKLGEVRRVLVASRAYLAAHGVPDTPAELTGHDLIALEGLEATNEWHFAGRNGAIRTRPRLSVNSADAAIAAAEAGIGIARALSYQVEHAIRQQRLVSILDAYSPPPVPVSAVYPDRIASSSITAFVRTAREYFKEHPVIAVGVGDGDA